jgi:DNA-binding IclR family transcriptional regulator
VNLAIPDGADILNVAEIQSTYILGCSGGWIGRRTKPHAVANGKVLLAHHAIPLPSVLERYTDHTITSLDELRAELAAVHRDGYAKAVAELEEGLVAVAVPVFGPAGACLAALSVSGPAYRMPAEMLDEIGRLAASWTAANWTATGWAGAGLGSTG